MHDGAIAGGEGSRSLFLIKLACLAALICCLGRWQLLLVGCCGVLVATAGGYGRCLTRMQKLYHDWS